MISIYYHIISYVMSIIHTYISISWLFCDIDMFISYHIYFEVYIIWCITFYDMIQPLLDKVGKTRCTWPFQPKIRYDATLANRRAPGVWFVFRFRMYLFMALKWKYIPFFYICSKKYRAPWPRRSTKPLSKSGTPTSTTKIESDETRPALNTKHCQAVLVERETGLRRSCGRWFAKSARRSYRRLLFLIRWGRSYERDIDWTRT